MGSSLDVHSTQHPPAPTTKKATEHGQSLQFILTQSMTCMGSRGRMGNKMIHPSKSHKALRGAVALLPSGPARAPHLTCPPTLQSGVQEPWGGGRSRGKAFLTASSSPHRGTGGECGTEYGVSQPRCPSRSRETEALGFHAGCSHPMAAAWPPSGSINWALADKADHRPVGQAEPAQEATTLCCVLRLPWFHTEGALLFSSRPWQPLHAGSLSV